MARSDCPGSRERSRAGRSRTRPGSSGQSVCNTAHSGMLRATPKRCYPGQTVFHGERDGSSHDLRRGVVGRMGGQRMNIATLTAMLTAGSFAAGVVGALTGLGGGVVIVPLLVIAFGVDIRYAIGASLVSVIATSSGAAAAYVREGFSNIRVGMFLEIATTLGALSGATLAAHVPANGLAIVFGLVLMYSAYLSAHRTGGNRPRSSPRSTLARPRARFDLSDTRRQTVVSRAPSSDRVWVDVRRRNPFRSVGDWLRCGQGPGDGPCHAAPVQGLDHHQQFHDRGHGGRQRGDLSTTRVYRPRACDAGRPRVLLGSIVGAHVLTNAKTPWLRTIFMGVIVVLALEMLYNGLTGKL